MVISYVRQVSMFIAASAALLVAGCGGQTVAPPDCPTEEELAEKRKGDPIYPCGQCGLDLNTGMFTLDLTAVSSPEKIYGSYPISNLRAVLVVDNRMVRKEFSEGSYRGDEVTKTYRINDIPEGVTEVWFEYDGSATRDQLQTRNPVLTLTPRSAAAEPKK